MTKIIILYCCFLFYSVIAHGLEETEYRYTYIERQHSKQEVATHLGSIYLTSWALYPLIMPHAFKEQGSWSNYRNNFAKIVFDQDQPFWNWLVHPLAGSQLFLFYRANGYSKENSLAMAFISSALFELTVEIYSEPASIQDLYQTPVLGSLIGLGIENLSLYLLNNSNNIFAHILGHAINPSTLFWFYDGKIIVTPQINPQDKNKSAALFLTGEF